MKKLPMIISLACSVLFSSCGDLGSSAFNSKSQGIHDLGNSRAGSTGNAYRFARLSIFRSSGSPNGFHPAPVSESSAKVAMSYSKDKHGMPTYPQTARNRVVRTTAYSHEENEVGAPWRKNAVGTYLKYGSVRSAAADWSLYPVGTKFRIKGLPHTYIVDDYGSALAGTNTIDIYHPNLSLMNIWGTRNAEITVIQWGSWDRTLAILKGRTAYPHTRKMYYAAKAKVESGKVAMN
jgi:3D (Asp-Asp-Asp) domain-containing protein